MYDVCALKSVQWKRFVAVATIYSSLYVSFILLLLNLEREMLLQEKMATSPLISSIGRDVNGSMKNVCMHECYTHSSLLWRAITRSLRLSLHYIRYFVYFFFFSFISFFCFIIHSPNSFILASKHKTHAASDDVVDDDDDDDAIKCSAL